MSGFKYRTWDKQGKVMEQYHYLQLSPNGQLYHDGMNVTDKYEILRFTGLKDKNGTEIYEGDSDGFYIVKHGEFPVRCHETSEVIDNAVGWYLDPIDKSMEPFNWEIPLNSFWINRLDDGFDKNIYDNPELLETK